jgi:hypothetical protein
LATNLRIKIVITTMVVLCTYLRLWQRRKVITTISRAAWSRTG